MRKRLIVAATGASGAPLLVQCLKLIQADGQFESCLILSDSARLTLRQETEFTEEEVEDLADCSFGFREMGAKPASGSFSASGMLVAPCSMKTLAGIHGGYADNLILRAADVTMKEQRTLVLAARETPLGPIHLRNMYELSMIPGVRIIPPMLAYYTKPQTVEEMTYQSAARLLEPFGIQAPAFKRWEGLSMSGCRDL